MVTKIDKDKKKNNFKITICANSARDKNKKLETLKNKKTKFNVTSPTTRITYDSCGHRIVRKVAASQQTKRLYKKPKKKRMTEKYTSYVHCPSFGVNGFRRSNDERGTVKGQNTLSQQSICIREIKKRDVPKNNTKSAECSSCCKNYYAAKDSYNSSRKMHSCQSYLNKSNNLDLNYDYKYKSFSDRYPTRYVPCPSSLKSPDQILSTYERRNSYNYSKNIDSYSTTDRIVCTNKNVEFRPQVSESSKQDTNLFKSFSVRNKGLSNTNDKYSLPVSNDKNNLFVSNDKNNLSASNDKNNFYNANDKHSLPDANGKQCLPVTKDKHCLPVTNDKYCCLPCDDKKMVQFFPRVATKFENGVLEAFSQFKISIQCYERGQGNQKNSEAANQETQTALEQKQQSVCTDLPIYVSKETQCEEAIRETRVDDLDTANIPKSICVSSDQIDKLEDELSDYYLLTPGGKCVRLAQKICSSENFAPCSGANYTSCDDESASICTETSYITQESKFVDSNTMTTPELLECVDKMLSTNNLEETKEEKEVEDSSKTEHRELIEKENSCGACKSNEVIDEDFKFCFEKLFQTKLSSSDCFPCLKEKLDKTGDLTKIFLYVLNYVLDMGSKLENNTNDPRFEPKNTKEIIKKLCKCVKKLSEVDVKKQVSCKTVQSTNFQNEENAFVKKTPENSTPRNKNTTSKTALVSRETETENEPQVENVILKMCKCAKKIATTQDPSISRSVNTIQKSVIEKQTETENRPIISRSMNTFVEEIPVEIIQTTLQNEGTNTDSSKLHKDAGTNTAQRIKFQDASTQLRLIEKCIKEKFPPDKYRDPILVRVISSNDRQKLKMQSQSSDYSTSENEEFRRNNYKQVCFNENTKFLLPKKNLRCEQICVTPHKNCTKVRSFDANNIKLKNKLLEKKGAENLKARSLENKKIFFSDFFN